MSEAKTEDDYPRQTPPVIAMHALPTSRGREMLQSLKEHYGVRISYAGPAEKRAFAAALVEESDLRPDVVDFALFDTEQCGQPIGANRNALLLHTVGELAFSTDDDVVCEVARAPTMKDGLAFEYRGDFTKFWFFPDRRTTLSSVTRVEEDILAIHERLLGRSLGGCIAEFSQGGLCFEQVASRGRGGGCSTDFHRGLVARPSYCRAARCGPLLQRDDRFGLAPSDGAVAPPLVVTAVAHHLLELAPHLVEQCRQDLAVACGVRRYCLRHDLARRLFHAEVELAPSAPPRPAVALDLPLALGVDFHAHRVHH